MRLAFTSRLQQRGPFDETQIRQRPIGLQVGASRCLLLRKYLLRGGNIRSENQRPLFADISDFMF